jgi:hypothetical protein
LLHRQKSTPHIQALSKSGVTAADAARRIVERSGLLVLEHGSASRISLIEGNDGRFALAVDAQWERFASPGH